MIFGTLKERNWLGTLSIGHNPWYSQQSRQFLFSSNHFWPSYSTSFISNCWPFKITFFVSCIGRNLQRIWSWIQTDVSVEHVLGHAPTTNAYSTQSEFSFKIVSKTTSQNTPTFSIKCISMYVLNPYVCRTL